MGDWYKRTPLAPPPREKYIPVRRVLGLRLAHGWSLAEVAARLHIPPPEYERIEYLRRVPNLDLLRRLARLFDVSQAQLRGKGLGPWHRPDLVRGRWPPA